MEATETAPARASGRTRFSSLPPWETAYSSSPLPVSLSRPPVCAAKVLERRRKKRPRCLCNLHYTYVSLIYLTEALTRDNRLATPGTSQSSVEGVRASLFVVLVNLDAYKSQLVLLSMQKFRTWSRSQRLLDTTVHQELRADKTGSHDCLLAQAEIGVWPLTHSRAETSEEPSYTRFLCKSAQSVQHRSLWSVALVDLRQQRVGRLTISGRQPERPKNTRGRGQQRRNQQRYPIQG